MTLATTDSSEILLIEDDDLDASHIRRCLMRATDEPYRLTRANTLSMGVECLGTAKFDVVLTDLNLPYSTRRETVASVAQFVDDVPIVILSGSEDREVAALALRNGIQDYLPKNEVTGLTLNRAIRYAIDRYKTRLHLSWLANHDPVTSLHNRHYFNERLEKLLNSSKRAPGHLGLAVLDLDNFKNVNDSYGHDVGGLLLIAVSKRLGSVIRAGDTLARLGGDEFAVIFSRFNNTGELIPALERISGSLDDRFLINGARIGTSCSIGVSICDTEDIDPNTLLKRADMALYDAKRDGRNRFHFYEDQLQQEMIEKTRTLEDLRGCLFDRDEGLSMHFQPIFDLRSGDLVSVEALARWDHPVQGPIPPGRFIAVAEQFNVMRDLGRWIFSETCRVIQSWRLTGFDVPVSINLSGHQFYSENLLDFLLETTKEFGIEPDSLTLEVTESMLLTKVDSSIQLVDRLRQHGFKVAIDDFGTGYSSLSYLTQFSVSSLKIDQSFLSDINADTRRRAVICAVLQLARDLGLDVVAEGIETAQQLKFLREIGCPNGQGYLLGRPETGDKLLESGVNARN